MLSTTKCRVVGLGRLGGAPIAQRRLLSKRAATVLNALDVDISEWPLPGVYDGRWTGSGEVMESVCPTTGEVIAQVRSVSTRDSFVFLGLRCFSRLGLPFKLQASMLMFRRVVRKLNALFWFFLG